MTRHCEHAGKNSELVSVLILVLNGIGIKLLF